jgi:hypothetical protein
MMNADERNSGEGGSSGLSRRSVISLAGFAALVAAAGGGFFAETAKAAPTGFNQPFTAPNPGITSPYGYRTHPLSGQWRLHAGTDYGMAAGRSIKAIAAGVVATNEYVGSAGNMIVVNHAGGISSTYMHMQTASPLAVGTGVNAGDHLGPTGATGGATGAHLHLEIRVNGSTVNPALFLDGAPYAGSTTTPPPTVKRKDMYIVRDVVNGTGSFVVTDNGVWGINGAQEEVLHRIMGSPSPAFVPLAASEITMIDQVLRANTNYND